ncbi:hypothetical protein [Vibrio coralliilyticus]|uniref:hypothetical protein n=1 Tax=Vibrio coralliilyticus TaxID=190893 RepID=UPI000375E1A6|nr:hypothetical protein [Vibrio coralliilyticus]
MSNTPSKIELLYMINDLKERGDIENVMRLQRLFLESISEDRESGKYSADVNVDRRGKKALNGARNSLIKSG